LRELRGRDEADRQPARRADERERRLAALAAREERRAALAERAHGFGPVVEERGLRGREGRHGALLVVDEMAEEAGRPPHGLAGVVDDEVEPRLGGGDPLGEALDARSVAEDEPPDREPRAPLVEVGLARVAAGGVVREARR